VDGQIMVMHDLLGITPPGIKVPRFVKNFMADAAGIREAFEGYEAAVKQGTFPAPEHCFL
jgi:3-methyl-2-oxobutanoate hydroxymethyltransferase